MEDFVSSYGWWILGALLLLGEVFLPGVYLLFFGIAALVIGANTLILPDLSWQSQLIGFAVVSGAAVLVGNRFYGRRSPAVADAGLNERTQRLVGRRASVSEAITNGRGRVALDDGWWSAEGPDLPAGTPVVIEAANGSVLRVQPAAEQDRDAV